MDIMELGAIGEFVSGLAVIGSLIYVGLQVQQSNLMAKAESARSQMYAYNAEFLTPLGQPERMRLFRDGVNDFESLDRNDQAAFHAQVIKVFNLGATDFALQQQRMVTEITSTAYQRWCASFLRTPGLDRWWEGTRRALPPDYVDYLENIRDAEDGPTLPELVQWYGPDEGS